MISTIQQSPKQEKFIRDSFWARVLCAFAYDDPRFYADSLHGANYKSMERLGIFVRDTPEMYTYCPRCKDDTPVDVFHDKNGKTTYWRVCCFPIKRINPKSFRVWQVRVQPMIDLFREQTGIKGSVTEIIPNQVWKWGRWGQQSFVYIRRVTEDDLKSVAAVLKHFPESIFITPRTCYLETLDIVLPNRGIAWDSVSFLDENYTIQFDLEKIEAIIQPEVKPKIDLPTRRGSREVKITRLVDELKEHYHLAKDHYYASDGDILPRPTQEELAKRTGICQGVVSRCLKDKSAIVLSTLWKNAENIEAILNS
jgi:hypothetical protein